MTPAQNSPATDQKPAVPPIRILGVGNEFRSDDAIGILVARRLKEVDLPHTIVLETTGNAGAPLNLWSTTDSVVFVDAVSSHSTPGNIIRIDVWKESIPSDLFGSSTHSFSVADSIELARVLGTLPERCVFFGIEGRDFRIGTSVTPSVLEAGEKVVTLIRREVDSWIQNSAFAFKRDQRIISST